MDESISTLSAESEKEKAAPDVDSVTVDGLCAPDLSNPASSRDEPDELRAREELSFFEQVAKVLHFAKLPVNAFGDDGKKKPKWKRTARETRQTVAFAISQSVKRPVWDVYLACKVVEEQHPRLKQKMRKLGDPDDTWDPKFAVLAATASGDAMQWADTPASPRGANRLSGPVGPSGPSFRGVPTV